MEIVKWQNLDEIEKLRVLSRTDGTQDENLEKLVSEIIQTVRMNQDRALYDYTLKFDKVSLDNLMVSDEEFKLADQLEQHYKDAINIAYHNIYEFHKKGMPNGFEYEKNGINLGKMYRPINKVGLYIPGGSAPLVSTLLMLAIPATLAGCKTIVLVTPPNRDGKLAPSILYAAKVCGVDTIYKVGGAQAIAALAFGTDTIPKVDKIFGPGNKYVTQAKVQVSKAYGGAALDMPAGPSEVLVICDKNANARFVASDLLAQAEHDRDAQVILVTTDEEFANKVLDEISLQTTYLSRKNMIEGALSKSRVIIAYDISQCFEISNRYAPEHLILHLENAKDYLIKVENAGSVFVGQFTPESVGDYASGTNHVLPTYGYANMYSGLDVNAFMKSISFQELSTEGINSIGKTVEDLATLEGLDAHKNAVSVRLDYIKNILGEV